MSDYPPQGQAVATASIAFSAGMSTLGNTQGIAGTVSRELILVGGNNVTLSQNIVGQTATVTISAGASILSHDSVYHINTIGAESQISFDTLSGHDHDGVDSKLIIIPQYLEVAISGKQYTSVKSAIDSIVDASATKPYVIKVYPGIYTESPFSMQPYVTIEGSEYFGTTIQTNDNTSHFITGAAYSAIRNVAIVGPTDTNKAAIYYTDQVPATTNPFVLQDVLIRKGYYGVWANPTVSTSTIHLISVNNWYAETAMHSFVRATGYGRIIAISSGFMCGASDAITKGFEADGANAELYLDLCSFLNTPVANIIDAVHLDNGGSARLSACTLSRGTNAIHIGPNGTGSFIIASACIIRNRSPYIFTTDIKIESATASANYQGIASRTKLSIIAGANFNGNFVDITSGIEGSVNLGEFYLGDLNNQLPLRDYGITTYFTGQKTGGAVTTTVGLGVNAANGSGFINTGTAVKAIAWLDTPKNITANTTEYIYTDSNGTVQTSSIKPDMNTNIILAVAYANATDVIFLAFYTRKLDNISAKIEHYTEEVMGPVWREGLDVTENATPLRLDVTSGEYYITPEEQLPVGATPITFTYWYRGAVPGTWNSITSQTDIDVTQYDNGSGVLAAMTIGKYKRDLLFVAVNGSGTQYHIVYGQTQFDDQMLAENGANPTPPDFVHRYSFQLVAIIVQKSTVNINKILDQRPIAHYTPPGHNTLPGLQGGNSISSQYYHLNSTQYTNIDQKIVAAAGTQTATSGTIIFSNSNNVSFGMSNSSIITATVTLPVVQNLNGSSGIMSISGSTNISVSNDNSTIFIYGPTNILNSMSIGGNTGTTNSSGITGGGFVIAGGSNITLSQSNNTISIHAQSQSEQPVVIELNGSSGMMSISNGDLIGITNNNSTISVINLLSSATTVSSITSANVIGTMASRFALEGHQHAGVQAAGVSNLGNSYGNTKVIPGQLILIGGNNISLSQSTAANNVISISISGFNLVDSNNISFGTNSNSVTATATFPSMSAGVSNIGTNDVGSTGLVSNRIVFAAGNNITLSQSTGGNSSATITIIGAAAGTGAAIQAIQAGTNTGTTGTIVFSNDNNVSFGMAANLSVITASASFAATNLFGGLAAGTQTATTGTVILSNSNNIIFGMSNSSIVTASVSDSVNIIAAGTQTANTSGTVVFSNSNNVSFGMSNSSIVTATATFSQTVQPGIQSLSAGTTNITTGEAVFSNSNNISFGANGQTITASVHAQQTGISSIAASDAIYTSGQVQFTGSNMITVKSGTGQRVIIDATQTIQTQNLHGLVVSDNTSGPFTIGTSGTVSFAGTNVTITANTANSSIVGFSVHPQQTGISGIQASDTTFSSGTVIFTGVGGGITISSNTGQRIDLSVAAQSTQTQNLHGLVVSNNTSGATTIGTSGTVSFAGTNITITANTANNSIIGFSVANPVGAGIGSISAGTTRVTSGEAVFSNSNNISFGVSGQTITATVHPLQTGISSIFAGTTRATSGEVVFSNANNISFGVAGNTMTASFSQSVQTQSIYTVPTLSYWGNAQQTMLDVNISGSHRSFFLFPLNPQADIFQGNMTVNTMYLLFENEQSNMTNAWGKTLSIGIYTTTGSSLSIVNSASTTWGTAANNSAVSSLFSGTRFLTIGTAQWSSQPSFSQGIYYVGMLADSSGSNIRMDMSGFRIAISSGIVSGTIGIGMTSGNTSIGKMPWIGVSTNTRTNLPTTIGLSELVKTGALYGFVPYIQFNNIRSNF